jgi:hypothetical protein
VMVDQTLIDALDLILQPTVRVDTVKKALVNAV